MRILGWMPSPVQVSWAKRDALLLLGAFFFNFFMFSSWWVLFHEATTRPWLLLAWLYGLVMLVPLAWRDRAPVTLFAIQWVLTIAAWPIMHLYVPVVGIPIALYAVAVHRDLKVSLPALLVSAIPVLAGAAVAFRVYSTLAQQLQSFFPNTILLVIVTASAWAAGLQTQSGEKLRRDLDREQEQKKVREAVAAERGRIAGELHDIISHAVTAIVVQAAGASRAADTDFAQVKRVMGHIETTGRQAMKELQRLVSVLDARDPTGLGEEFWPQPSLRDLARMLDSFRDTGMPVTVHFDGVRRDLDSSVDLAAYRIVQEGLTNVLKHAGIHSDPHLELDWAPDNLIIQIRNKINFVEARRGQTLSVGRGLVGLRERVQAAGGSLLHAGLHDDGDYLLRASLPLAVPEVSSAPWPGSKSGDQERRPA